ncbi:small membrane protein [Streptomyces ruber]|uniref:Small membrane protein n=2 Tax=Streptomyces TaxID=1883 RepID=A0A918BN87_9ACTN|nr:chaplin [Streptomyces ruber]GGQ80583.1 small membrane protein [Streptomyces ruber]
MKNLKQAAAVTLLAGGLVTAVAGPASASSGADGATVHSPGVLAGNLVQVPVHIPVNVVGNGIKVVGVMNPSFGEKGVTH